MVYAHGLYTLSFFYSLKVTIVTMKFNNARHFIQFLQTWQE